jgi:hypothetical protein
MCGGNRKKNTNQYQRKNGPAELVNMLLSMAKAAL